MNTKPALPTTDASLKSIIQSLGAIGGAIYLQQSNNKILQLHQSADNYLLSLPFLQNISPFDLFPLSFLLNSSSFFHRCLQEKKVILGSRYAEFVTPCIDFAAAQKIQSTFQIESLLSFPLIDQEDTAWGIFFICFPEEPTLQTIEFLKSYLEQYTTTLSQQHKYSTLQEQYQKHQQLLSDQSDFIATSMHEFRTPLSIALFQAEETVDMLKTDPEKKAQALTIYTALQQLHQITEKLFEVEQYTLDQVRPRKEAVSIYNFVQNLYTKYKPLCSQQTKTLLLKNTLPQYLEIDIDPIQIQQVLQNLLTNALKFSPSKGEIIMTATCTSKNILIQVQDNGRGVPPEKQDLIFQKFGRNHTSDTDGLGLGLYVCKHIMQLHNGAIWAENAPQGGAVFTVQCPRS